MALLEVCCFNPESAIIASQAGADRIEFCDSQHAGGTTPPAEWLTHVKASVTIPVFVMIRPRGGDFCFSDAEFEKMKTQIDELKTAADGFVFGILDQQRNVDIARTTELVRRAVPLPCTFHRAFDETSDPMQAFEDVIATGCHAILSSGGAPSVNGGLSVLKALIERSQGRIAVMPGGGVRSSNLASIQEATGANQFHSSAMNKDSGLADAEEVRLMKQLLHEHASGVTSRLGGSFPDQNFDQSATDEALDLPAVSIGVTPVDERQLEF